jgi:hypothetical protein
MLCSGERVQALTLMSIQGCGRRWFRLFADTIQATSDTKLLLQQIASNTS